MNEMTELEQLARLVGGGTQDREIIDSGSMIEDALKSKLGSISREKVKEMEMEIRNHGDSIETKDFQKQSKYAQKASKESSLSLTSSTEKVLLELYDLRDESVEAFETCNINSKTSSILAGQINKMATLIRYMGGEVAEFEPLSHVSGLVAPNFYKNAQKVLETTKQCYSLGEVGESQVLENGRKIEIIFTGSGENVTYIVKGNITSDEWTGNEAIDYIYTPGSGKMSVKAFENGRWIDRSASGKYKIFWDLEESEFIPSTKQTKQNGLEKQAKSHALNHTPNVEQTIDKPNEQILEEVSGEEDIGTPIN